MATYNGATYLRAQLESLATQTLRPAELVVGDDGSTDETISILKDFASNAPFPVRVESNTIRQGYADNFLAAAARCNTPLIAFCDQDDVWLPTKLQRCAREFDDPEVSLVIHNGIITKSDLTPTPWLAQPELRSRRELRRITGSNLASHHGMRMLFRRSLITTIPWDRRPVAYDILGEPRIMAHDRWIPFLASFLGKSILIPDRLVLYRQHEQNTFGIGSNAAEMQSLGKRMELIVATNGETYAKWAALAASCASFLEETATILDRDTASKAVDGACYFRRLCASQTSRADLYRIQERSKRLRHLITMCRNGYYASKEAGGLGKLSLVKDVAGLCR